MKIIEHTDLKLRLVDNVAIGWALLLGFAFATGLALMIFLSGQWSLICQRDEGFVNCEIQNEWITTGTTIIPIGAPEGFEIKEDIDIEDNKSYQLIILTNSKAYKFATPEDNRRVLNERIKSINNFLNDNLQSSFRIDINDYWFTIPLGFACTIISLLGFLSILDRQEYSFDKETRSLKVEEISLGRRKRKIHQFESIKSINCVEEYHRNERVSFRVVISLDESNMIKGSYSYKKTKQSEIAQTLNTFLGLLPPST